MADRPDRQDRPPVATVALVADPDRARHLLDPLRVRILGLAQRPASASDLAGQLGLGRQRTNYHVKQLVAAGLLEPAGSRVRRGLEERFYRATAASYVIAPQAAGAMAPPESAAHAGEPAVLAALLLADLARADEGRRERDRDRERERDRSPPAPAAVAATASVRLATAAQRKAFAAALQEAVDRVVEAHGGKGAGGGPAYRVVVAAAPKAEEPRPGPAPEARGGPGGPRADRLL